MQIIDLGIMWTVVLDFVAWFLLHMFIAWGATQLPLRFFRPTMWLYRTRAWEHEGKIYEYVFVDKWKRLLPDGAALFRSGFKKKNLKTAETAYLERFVKETCRGECAHYMVIAVSPVFFLFNPWYAGVIMIIYALLANGPCIIAQRYNRPRMQRTLDNIRQRRGVKAPSM